MIDGGTYLFAIGVATQSPASLDALEVPESFEPVRGIIAEGLVAFVSTYRGPAIEDLPQNELTARLLMNQMVIEQLMPAGTLLPVRLGTVMDDDDAVISLLRTSGALLRTACDVYAAKVEIGIAATWHLQEILAQVALDPEVMAAKSVAMTVPAAAHAEAAISVGKLVEAKLHERRSTLEQVVLTHLQPFADDVQFNAVVSDELICNIALLIDHHSVDQIDQVLYRLDAEFEGQYDFRRVGPLPPYSFATVHMHQIDSIEIDRARAILDLPHHFDEPAVLAQYRELALKRHPDAQGAGPSAAKEFEELTKARATLVSLCQHPSDHGFDPTSRVVLASIERSIGRD